MEISWTDRVRNEELQGVKEKRTSLLAYFLTYVRSTYLNLLTPWSRALLEN